MASAPSVFLSYSHADANLRDELNSHLKGLERGGIIRGWSDRELVAGDVWRDRILEGMERAQLIILLVSADYLASDYVYDVEMRRALERHDSGSAMVIPVIVRPCEWTGAPFAKLQALPRDAKPVTSWEHRDEAWTDVMKGLRAAARRFAGAEQTSDRSTGRAELARLLAMLLGPQELRYFLTKSYGETMLYELPGHSGHPETIFRVLDALDRRGLIDKAFFDLLLEERPRRAEEILRVRDNLLRIQQRPSPEPWDFFLSNAQEDAALALELHDLLSASARVFLASQRLIAGEDFAQRIRDTIADSRFVVILVSRASIKSNWVRQEIAIATRAHGRQRSYIVPVYLERVESPYALSAYQGITFNPEKGVGDVAAQLLQALERVRREGRLVDQDRSEAVDSRLRDLARQFFKAAGREMTGTSTELNVPEPVWTALDTPASPLDARSLARLLGPGQVGYFVYGGALPEDTLQALDALRVQGNPIVPISANAMTAALADGAAATLLREIDAVYRSKDNLFDTRNALVDERFFFGRHDLLAQIGGALTRGEHVMVIGLRKAGKTSLLNILRQHLAAHPVCWIDLERYDRHEEDWPPLLFRQIVASFDQWGSSEYTDWPARDEHPGNASELEVALRLRRRWQLDRGRQERLIVVLDEVERILPARSGEDQEARRFIRAAGALRSLAQSGEDRFLSLIAADLRPEVNRRNRFNKAGTNPFFSFFQEVPLPLLSEEAVSELVKSIGRAMGISEVTEGFVRRILKEAGGHPFITRLIAGAAYTRSRTPGRLDEADIEAGLEELAERDTLGSFFRENLWGELSPLEREVLQAAVRQQKADNSVFGRIIGIFRSGRPAKASSHGPQRALLSQLGLLSDGRVPIGLFAEWITEFVDPDQSS